MKKIEHKMCKAMLYKESFKTDNTEVKYVPHENKSFAYLWGSCIGTLHHETRELTVSNCGYSTVTTKSRINAMLSNPSLDPNMEASLRGDLAAIVDRQMMIEGAIDDTKGDNPSFEGISNIYGTAARDFVINSSPRAVDIDSISPTFRETISAQPIVVVSPTHLQVLFETGAINDNSVILYEGQEILVGDIPEAEGQ